MLRPWMNRELERLATNTATAKPIDDSKPNGDPTMTTNTTDTARAVQEAQAALDAAKRKHADAIADQAPPKKVSEMTPAERKAAARQLGISGPV